MLCQGLNSPGAVGPGGIEFSHGVCVGDRKPPILPGPVVMAIVPAIVLGPHQPYDVSLQITTQEYIVKVGITHLQMLQISTKFLLQVSPDDKR